MSVFESLAARLELIQFLSDLSQFYFFIIKLLAEVSPFLIKFARTFQIFLYNSFLVPDLSQFISQVTRFASESFVLGFKCFSK